VWSGERKRIVKMGKFGRSMKLKELPPSLRVVLRVEALKRNADPEALLTEILEGGNPIPQHLSELIREVWKSRPKGDVE
jgi:hypothetical protein